MQLEPTPVVHRVGDDQQQDVDGAIPKLLAELPIQSLDVGEVGLRLAPGAASPEGNECVPCPLVARDREGHLAVHARERREQGDEAVEESELGGVADRITIRVHPSRVPEADRETGSARLVEREPRKDAALDPTELRVRHPGRRGGVALRQSRAGPRHPDLLADLRPHLASEPLPVDLALMSCHAPIVTAGTYRRLIRELVELIGSGMAGKVCVPRVLHGTLAVPTRGYNRHEERWATQPAKEPPVGTLDVPVGANRAI